MMRKHYMTLYTRGNQGIEVSHIKKNGVIEVTCEQAVNGGFNSLVTDIDGNIINSYGFNGSDIQYLVRFIRKSKEGIMEESEGVIA